MLIARGAATGSNDYHAKVLEIVGPQLDGEAKAGSKRAARRFNCSPGERPAVPRPAERDGLGLRSGRPALSRLGG